MGIEFVHNEIGLHRNEFIDEYRSKFPDFEIHIWKLMILTTQQIQYGSEAIEKGFIFG